jgi:hypothetical protein
MDKNYFIIDTKGHRECLFFFLVHLNPQDAIYIHTDVQYTASTRDSINKQIVTNYKHNNNNFPALIYNSP